MKQYADIASLFGAFMLKICLLKRVSLRLVLAKFLVPVTRIEKDTTYVVLVREFHHR